MISEEDQAKYQKIVRDYVTTHGKITNRECRKLLDIFYDNSIKLLTSLCEAGILVREGVSSGTKYVLRTEENH
jgi:predicted HTH transcriptional regulator